MLRPLADRLWEKVDRSAGPEACWPYMPSQHRNTYGMIYDPDALCVSKNIGTHKAAYQVTYGPVAPGQFVCHRCNWKPCCQPLHLYLGTHQQNMFDARRDGLIPVPELPHHAKVVPEEVHAIRLLRGIWTRAKIADKFGLSENTVSSIFSGDSWEHVAGPLQPEEEKNQKSHCHKGHPLTPDNIIYSHRGQNRNCKICYYVTQNAKSHRRFLLKRDEINAQRRARRGSTVRRFTDDEQSLICQQYATGTESYYTLAATWETTYSTIHRIVKGTYAGARYVFDSPQLTRS